MEILNPSTLSGIQQAMGFFVSYPKAMGFFVSYPKVMGFFVSYPKAVRGSISAIRRCTERFMWREPIS